MRTECRLRAAVYRFWIKVAELAPMMLNDINDSTSSYL